MRNSLIHKLKEIVDLEELFDQNITEILFGSPHFSNNQSFKILKFTVNSIKDSKRLTGSLFWCRTICFKEIRI